MWLSTRIQDPERKDPGVQRTTTTTTTTIFSCFWIKRIRLSNTLGFVNGSSCGVLFLLPSVYLRWPDARCLMSHRSILFMASVTLCPVVPCLPSSSRNFQFWVQVPFPITARKQLSWTRRANKWLASLAPKWYLHAFKTADAFQTQRFNVIRMRKTVKISCPKLVLFSTRHFRSKLHFSSIVSILSSQSNRSWFPADRRGVGWGSHFHILPVCRLGGRCLQVWTMWFQQSSGGGLLTNQKLLPPPPLSTALSLLNFSTGCVYTACSQCHATGRKRG